MNDFPEITAYPEITADKLRDRKWELAEGGQPGWLIPAKSPYFDGWVWYIYNTRELTIRLPGSLAVTRKITPAEFALFSARILEQV